MYIRIWPDGSWKYDWEVGALASTNSKLVDIDRWFDYQLSDKELLACEQAIERAEELLND